MALGEFYEALPEAIDEIVETYQGGFDLIGVGKAVAYPVEDIIERIGEEGKWIAKHREEIARDNEALENLLDGLVGTYMRTFYKLTNLR